MHTTPKKLHRQYYNASSRKDDVSEMSERKYVSAVKGNAAMAEMVCPKHGKIPNTV